MSETYDSSRHFLHSMAKLFRKRYMLCNIDHCLNNKINLDKLFKRRILSQTSTEGSGKNEKNIFTTGLQVHLEEMF